MWLWCIPPGSFKVNLSSKSHYQTVSQPPNKQPSTVKTLEAVAQNMQLLPAELCFIPLRLRSNRNNKILSPTARTGKCPSPGTFRAGSLSCRTKFPKPHFYFIEAIHWNVTASVAHLPFSLTSHQSQQKCDMSENTALHYSNSAILYFQIHEFSGQSFETEEQSSNRESKTCFNVNFCFVFLQHNKTITVK